MKNVAEKNLDNLHNSFCGQHISTKLVPAFYIIEATNCCNYECSICPNRLFRSNEKGNLSFSLLKKIINEIKPYAEIIQLYWMGEPFLNSSLIDMIKYCKKHTSAEIMISTNGSLLTPNTIKELASSGLDSLIVSLDAAESNEIYSAIRRKGADISIVNKSILQLLNANTNIDITLQFIQMNLNENERQRFIHKWERYKVNILFENLYSWANQFEEMNEWSSHLSPMRGKPRTACSDLWYKIAIHWNGDVRLCCFDWKLDDSSLGNVTLSSIEDIWNSEKIMQIRSAHQLKRFDAVPLCSKCDAWATEDEYKTLYRKKL